MKSQRVSYLFIAPALLIIGTFVIVPVFFSLFLSFTQYDMFHPPEWTGLNNYIAIFFHDKLFWIAIKNTFIYVLGTVPVGIALSLMTAVFIDQKIKFKSIYKTAFFMPTVTSIVAIAVMWKWMYAGSNYGLINYVINKLAIPGFERPVDWLVDPRWTLVAIMIMSMWAGIGYNMVLFLAGLQGISDSLYEAADIDGANAWQKFVKITLPMLKPAILFVMVMSVIGSFQVFDQVYVMTGSGEFVGGTLHSALTIVTYLYERGFERYQMGYACALAYTIFVIIFLLTLLNFKLLHSDEYY